MVPRRLICFKFASYSELGAIATDDRDGNISNRVTITVRNQNGNVVSAINTQNLGTYTLTYNVSDNAGNTASAIRSVNIVRDSVPPVLTLRGNNPLSLTVNDTYAEPGATAIDNVDGNISANIRIRGQVNASQVGTYILIYQITDRGGNYRATNTYGQC